MLIVFTCQDKETTEMTMEGWIYNENGIYTYSGLLFVFKNVNPVIHANIDELGVIIIDEISLS